VVRGRIDSPYPGLDKASHALSTYSPCCEKRCEMSGENGGNLRKLGEGLKCCSPSIHAVLLSFSWPCDSC
jgi:hypothetical protein